MTKKARTPSRPRPSNQGSAGRAYIQPPRHSGRPRDVDRAPKTRELNTSINKPGKGTSGDGKTHRKPQC